jgi:hypothetical protein
MFSRSGCLNKSSPSGRTGPWCAVTNCTAWTHDSDLGFDECRSLFM